jgi:hypothetical protein
MKFLKYKTANLFHILSSFTFTVALPKDAAVYVLLSERLSHQLVCVPEGKLNSVQ